MWLMTISLDFSQLDKYFHEKATKIATMYITPIKCHKSLGRKYVEDVSMFV